jgi:hypothetical protein
MYCLLWNLRRRIWNEAGWPIPDDEAEYTKQTCPHAPVSKSGDTLVTTPAEISITNFSSDATRRPTNVNEEQEMIFGILDDLFAAQSLHDFQWDKWEDLMGRIFPG